MSASITDLPPGDMPTGFWKKRYVVDSKPKVLDMAQIRDKLPPDLDTWRNSEEAKDIWQGLSQVLKDHGYTTWNNPFLATVFSPGDEPPVSTGFGYVTAVRGRASAGSGCVDGFSAWCLRSPLSYVARSAEGHDVIVRVVKIGRHGQEHVNILREVARGDLSFFSNNHSLQMFAEIAFGDVVFGVFPKVGYSVRGAYGYWAENSVGDVLDMILQTLEGLAFLHENRIAHRDVHKGNLLVQWYPESLKANKIPISRPRVYLIDFELAVQFPPDCPPKDRVAVGVPLGGSIIDARDYGREVPPEVTSGLPYDPFKLDVWPLGESFSDFESTIHDIDTCLLSLARETNPVMRLSAAQALNKLSDLVHALPPRSLLLPPVVHDHQTSASRIGLLQS